jgi:hypothetical protein
MQRYDFMSNHVSFSNRFWVSILDNPHRVYRLRLNILYKYVSGNKLLVISSCQIFLLTLVVQTKGSSNPNDKAKIVIKSEKIVPLGIFFLKKLHLRPFYPLLSTKRFENEPIALLAAIANYGVKSGLFTPLSFYILISCRHFRNPRTAMTT